MGKQHPTFKSQEVPDNFWEPGITGGYRKPGITHLDSIASVFQLHNESLNIWTHLLALAFFLGYLYKTCLTLDLYGDDKLHLLLCMFLSSCLYLITSTLAHTFNSMTELSQHAGFMLDYYGISVYALVTAISNFTYSFPDEWRSTSLEYYYIPVSLLSCTLAVSLSCKSRFGKFGVACKLMRLVPFVLSYFISMGPLLYRVATSYSHTDGTLYFYRHFVDAALTFSFYSSHFPEIAFPGYFNVYFHSHQIFHVLVSLGTYFKLQGLMADIALRHSYIKVDNCVLIVLAAAAFNGLVTIYYIRQMYNIHKCKLNGKQSLFTNGNGAKHTVKNTNGYSDINKTD